MGAVHSLYVETRRLQNALSIWEDRFQALVGDEVRRALVEAESILGPPSQNWRQEDPPEGMNLPSTARLQRDLYRAAHALYKSLPGDPPLGQFMPHHAKTMIKELKDAMDFTDLILVEDPE